MSKLCVLGSIRFFFHAHTAALFDTIDRKTPERRRTNNVLIDVDFTPSKNLGQ